MKDAGVKPGALAKKLGITYQAVSKVLKGTSGAFTAANNAAAAAFLGVSPDWLATGSGARRERPLSPLALDLARAFDALPLAQRQNLHAHLMYTIELASAPRRPEGAPAPLPTEQLPRGSLKHFARTPIRASIAAWPHWAPSSATNTPRVPMF